jgi:hypothetical protein
MPGNALHLGFIATLLPRARIILCRRDPRDVGLSIFQHRLFGYHPYAHDLADLGWYIAQHDRLMAHWQQVLPRSLLEVPLEDWVADFDATLRRVLAFLDLGAGPCARHRPLAGLHRGARADDHRTFRLLDDGAKQRFAACPTDRRCARH